MDEAPQDKNTKPVNHVTQEKQDLPKIKKNEKLNLTC